MPKHATVFAGISPTLVELLRLAVLLTILPASLSRAATRFGVGRPGWPKRGPPGGDGSRSDRGRADELIRLRVRTSSPAERDILSKAAAWFARETGTLPSGSSGS